MKGDKFPDIPFESLSFPPAELKIVRRNGIYKVFDRLRKNYFCLTEEEFIRQCFVSWMIDHLKYPASLMANEVGIRLNETIKRCDTVVYSSFGNPLMIVEYKSPKISISQEVFDQIVRYNMVMEAPYLIVSNGLNHFCCKIDLENKSYKFLQSVPTYPELLSL